MSYAPYPFQHTTYNWDGAVTAQRGNLNRCWLISFNGHYGDVAESLIPLVKAEWNWQAPDSQNRLGGILFEVAGSPDTAVRFSSKTADMEFTIGDLLRTKVICRHIGQRYSNVDVTAMFDGYDPGLDRPQDSQMLTEIIGHPRRLILGTGLSRADPPLVLYRLGMGAAGRQRRSRRLSGASDGHEERRSTLPGCDLHVSCDFFGKRRNDGRCD